MPLEITSKRYPESLQVALAVDIYEKKNIGLLRSYLKTLKDCDTHSFQKMGTYLRNEENNDMMAKIYMLWCEAAKAN